MVEYTSELDAIFGSLADETRRDILRRLSVFEMTVSEIAAEYAMSLAAVSKHIKILEQAGLVAKRKKGKQRFVYLSPEGLQAADEYLDRFYAPWRKRFEDIESH